MDISNSFDVFVDENASAVTITAGENIMSRVIVEQVGGELKIYCKPTVVSVNGDYMKAIIPHSPALKHVTISGASSLESPYPVNGNDVSFKISGDSRFSGDISGSETKIDLSGASLIKSNITADNLDLKLSGASMANLKGQTSNLNLNFSGASLNRNNVGLKGYALECTDCTGSISGASKAYIHCLNSINVSLSGASTLNYTGEASTSGSSTSGASSIVHDSL